MKRDQTPSSEALTWADLYRWYETPLGQALFRHEQHHLEEVLAGLFGYHLLQVGRPCGENLLTTSRISHCMVMDIDLNADGDNAIAERFCGYPHFLPVSGASLDAVVLPHVLEFASQPHEVLREVERVLIPEGHAVLLGFNPWSSWMLSRAASGWTGKVPWSGRFRSVGRIKDWLILLGFEVVRSQVYFFRPPFNHAGLLNRLNFLEKVGPRLWPMLGAGYVLVARKKVETLTPIRPRWRPRRRLVATGLVGERLQGNVRHYG